MPGYLLKHENIAIAGVADLRIRSLLDKQQFADPLGAAEAQGISSAAWPLFGLLWPSGLHLAVAMGRRALRVDESILEIGCGLGLASLVSHRRGALVTASDSHPLAAGFMLENLRLNALPPLRYCHGNWAAASLNTAQAAPRVQGRFDLIMGSDVLYERDEAGSLAAFIALHALPVSEVMIVDPNRGNRSAFGKHMAALGYRLDELTLHAAPGAAAYAGRLLHFHREC